jgi:hypothetical protein
MLAFANSYTSGTSDARSSGSTVATTGPETRVVTLRSKVTNNTLPKSWLQWASARLDDIATLEPNWNSYGAHRPSPLAIAIASELLLIVDKNLGSVAYERSQPQVVAPRADGGIQIRWGTRPVEIAVHADPSGTLGYLYVERRGDTTSFKEVQSASWDEVLQMIATVVFAVPR